MKKLIVLLILLVAVIFTAGCAQENQDNSTDTQAVQEGNDVVEPTESGQNTTPQETQEVSNVVEMTDLEQINASLNQGPVFMKIESEHCGTCKAMEPMIQELATEYEGRARFVSIDMSRSPQLTKYFDAGFVPDITVIVGIKDGEYAYMQPDGNVTTDRFKARITGPGEKDIYEDVLNHALIQSEKDKSQ